MYSDQKWAGARNILQLFLLEVEDSLLQLITGNVLRRVVNLQSLFHHAVLKFVVYGQGKKHDRIVLTWHQIEVKMTWWMQCSRKLSLISSALEDVIGFFCLRKIF